MWWLINFIQIVLVFFWTAFCAVLGIVLYIPIRNPKIPMIVARRIWSRPVLFICGVKLQISGRENLDLSTAKIYASNHESGIDIPAIFVALPVSVYFIAKKELKKAPFMGWYMQVVGMIFIDRENREKALQSLRDAGELIKKGKNVISFPEGKRSRDGNMAMFKRGTFILSTETGIPVVPMAISGAREVMPVGTLATRPGTVKLHIGKPMEPLPGEKPDEMAKRVMQTVAAMRNDLKES